MGNERLSKRVILGEVEGGRGYSGRARAGLDELPRKRPIAAVQVTERNRALDAGSQETGVRNGH